MKKLGLIAVLALGSLLLCNTSTMAQDTNNAGTSGSEGKQGRRGFGTPEQRLERMSKELNLTDEQKPKVKAALEEQHKEMQDVPESERREKGREIMQKFDKKMKDILTPEQYTKWEANRAQYRGKGGGKKKSDSQ